MPMGVWSKRAALAASMMTVTGAAGLASAQTAPAEDVSAELKALQVRVAELEAKQNENWLTEERTKQIQGIVEGVLADARNRGQMNLGPDAGYNNGFYIQTPDKSSRLQVNGYLQFRYVYAHDEVKNASSFAARPASGDESEYGFRRARLIFQGNVLSPNLIYMISGDMGTTASNSGAWQILDTFIGYNFTPEIKVKGGAMLVPFTYAEIYSGGLSLPEFSASSIPFDAVRTLGVSVYGDLIKDQLFYEVQMNDGSKANPLGRPGDTGGSLDSRMGYYARIEWAGNGGLADLRGEPDLRPGKDSGNFIWMLGAAAGYEEQNSQASAFPALQKSLVLMGLSSNTSPGFVASQTVNGGLYRGTVDFHAKYQGLSLAAMGYIQQYNDQLPVGAKTDAFRTAFHTGSLFQAGYSVQAGYFLVPQKWEVVGRFGQLLTEGLPNRMEEYTLGLNYYLFGNSAKLQLAETFIPNEAAFGDSGSNTAINTQDLITQIQFQLKF